MIGHTPHDYAHLQERWKRLASDAGLAISTLAVTTGGEPVMAIESWNGPPDTLYLSAGIHGDECAAVWGLLHWAEQNAASLKELPLLLFPCLNPDGFLQNTRTDADGHDLNRTVSDQSIAVVAAWHNLLQKLRFSRCLHLHEDYDALGIYVYELNDAPGLGRKILDSCSHHIPADPRPSIDGETFDQGLFIRNSGEVRRLLAGTELEGAEPVQLLLRNTGVSITFETPSELDLGLRIVAHVTAIETFVADWY